MLGHTMAYVRKAVVVDADSRFQLGQGPLVVALTLIQPSLRI